LDLPAEESANNSHQPCFLACLSSFVSKVAEAAGSARTPTDKNSEEIKDAEATEPVGSARTPTVQNHSKGIDDTGVSHYSDQNNLVETSESRHC
jgi:hypothetical protein